MKDFKYRYGICSVADKEIYKKQCLALEKNIVGLVKQEELIDVDSSKISKYIYNEDTIYVVMDNTCDDVHINSDIELEQFFR